MGISVFLSRARAVVLDTSRLVAIVPDPNPFVSYPKDNAVRKVLSPKDSSVRKVKMEQSNMTKEEGLVGYDHVRRNEEWSTYPKNLHTQMGHTQQPPPLPICSISSPLLTKFIDFLEVLYCGSE